MADVFSPAGLMEAIGQIERGAAVTTTEFASEIEQQMRANARWNDRNGPSVTGLNARQSLNAQVEYIEADQVHLVAMSDRASPHLWHGAPAPVAAFLELGTRYMDKYDVIWPTLTAQTPGLQHRLQAMLDGDL